MRHLIKNMPRQIHDVVIHIIHGVGEGDGDDLFIVFAAVGHGDIADGVAAHQRQRLQRLRAQDQNIQRVVVVAVGAGDKAVVRGIMSGGIKDPVQNDKAGLLVQLIFLLAALGDLNDSQKVVGMDPRGVYIVPDIHGYDRAPSAG